MAMYGRGTDSGEDYGPVLGYADYQDYWTLRELRKMDTRAIEKLLESAAGGGDQAADLLLTILIRQYK